MGLIAKNCYEYLYQSQWIREGSPWSPPPTDMITLRDEVGAVIGSTTMATISMTIYNVGTHTVIPGADAVNVKNARRCTLSAGGVFLLKLLSADTAIIDATREHEVRRILIKYTWPATPTNSDSLEITVVVKNLYLIP